MPDISFRDFRGFHNQESIPVKPITILVGENSAGKSSFIAGLKYILDFASGESEPSCNSDPFQLGTFPQIAHFRGGRGGCAREFGISLRDQVRLRRPRKEDINFYTVELSLTFSNSDSQASISSISVKDSGESLVATVTSDGIRIEFISKRGDRFPVEEASSIPRVARTEFSKYWPFLLRNLQFRFLRASNNNQPELFSDDSIRESVTRLAELATAISHRHSVRVEATSGIRTKPLRTYTPGLETEDGEVVLPP